MPIIYGLNVDYKRFCVFAKRDCRGDLVFTPYTAFISILYTVILQYYIVSKDVSYIVNKSLVHCFQFYMDYDMC